MKTKTNTLPGSAVLALQRTAPTQIPQSRPGGGFTRRPAAGWLRFMSMFVIAAGLLFGAASAQASHFTDTTVNYSGALVAGGPTTGTVSGANNVAQWWTFNVIAGTPVTITATRTSGTLIPNLRAYRGTVAENASPSTMPILDSTSNGSLASISITFTPSFTGAGTLQVSRITTDTGNYTITATGIVNPNTPPTANAGPDRSVFDRNASNVATTVVLDGTASSDPEHAPLTYAWTQVGGPVVALTGANTATPSFVAPDLHNHPSSNPVPVVLTFRLTVNDGTFTSLTDDVVITVKHENLAPVAVASAPAMAAEGTPVTLNGSASTDGDFDALSYLWTQISGTPVGLPLVATNNPTLNFTANVAGPHSVAGETLTFLLTVSDGIAGNTTAVPLSIFIQNVNQPPVADAEPAVPVFDNVGLVTLTGSATDPDGDSVALLWTQIAGPAVVLNDATTGAPSFTAPAVTPAQGSVTLTFQLIANDGNFPGDPDALNSAPSTVDVLIKHANRAPIADAGQNKNVPEQTMATLDGSGSYDPDQDAITYNWTQTVGPVVNLDITDPVHPTFLTPDVGPAGATLAFQLVVSDTPTAGSGSSLASTPSTVTINVTYVNHPPVAVTGPNQAANEGTVVGLDGSASSDPDGNTFTYLWTQTGGPAVVGLSDAAAGNPTFTAPAVDRFGATVTFSLQVTDQFGAASNVATTSVAVGNINRPPSADAGLLQSVPEDTDVALAGAGLDQDTEEQPLLAYAWVQTAGPAVVLTGANTQNPTFHAPLVTAGGDPLAKVTLKFTLTVTDPNNASASAGTCVTVTNVDHAPLANAGGITLANEAVLVPLDGSASSDPDGDALTFAWVQTAGPAVTLANANTATPSFTAPFVSAAGATLKFKLTVYDGFGGISSDTATVTVRNINDPPTLVNPRASVACLWPPNHRMVPISILGVMDPNNNATIQITSVTQDEATNGLGDGDTAIDAIINNDGTVLLRAERSGKGNGRVYHIHFTASDLEGSVSGVVTVCVPHSKATDAAIDGGELFDSTR